MFLAISIGPAVEFKSLEQVLVVTEPPPRLDEQVKD
jgi:hypothetical protein